VGQRSPLGAKLKTVLWSQHPHIIDVDERMANFSGNLSDDKLMRRPISFLTSEVVGYKLIDADSFQGPML
jgi:hypothetical protein